MNQNISIRFWLLGFLFLFSRNIFAQGKLVQNFKFRSFNIENGLNHQVIRDIFQDQNGFVWIATPNGLNRFDGIVFKSYFNQPDVPNSLGNNNIFRIEGDQNGNLWIATLRGGLDLYEPLSHRFRHFRHTPKDSASILSDEVVSLFFTSENKLLGGTRFGIFETSITADTLKTFANFHFATDSTELKYAYDIIEMPGQKFWFASRDGLFYSEQLNVGIQKLFPAPGFLYNRFNNFLKIDNETLWVVYNRNQLLDISGCLDVPSPHLAVDLGGQLGLKDVDEITDLLLTAKDLWIATTNGLYQYPGFEVGKPFPSPIIHLKGESPMSLSNNHISCLLQDRENNIWIGSADGLNLYHKDYQFFNHLTFIPDNPNVGLIDEFRNFLIDKNGHLWICSSFGIHIFKNILEQWTEIKRIPIEDFQAREAIRLLEYSDGSIWLAAYGSLSRIDLDAYRDFSIKSYQHNKGSNSSASTELLLQIEKGIDEKLYLTGYSGVLRFDPKTETFDVIPTPEKMYLTSLVYDNSRSCWYAGSQLGILEWREGEDELSYMLNSEGRKPLENDRVKFMLPEGDSLLWVGGGNGLHKIDLHTKTRKTYHLNEGLRDVFIGSLFQDSKKNIWLTNSQGIDVLIRSNDQFIHFGLEDGLQGTAFSTRNVFIEKSGKVWLAGNQGINQFQPDSLYDIRLETQGRLTGITLNNRKSPTVPAEKLPSKNDTAPFAVDQLKLRYKDNWLTLAFSTMNFTHPGKIIQEYRLRPNDSEWTQLQPGQQITYTNLPAGIQELFIRSKINNRIIREEKVLTIDKKPPPWKTPLAYLLYILTITGGAWLWIKNKERQIKRENALIEAERESFRKRSARDFHDESGHHITKISILSELVLRDAGKDEKLHQYAAHISESVQRLRGGMRDFIWVLDPDNDNLFNTVARIKETGNQLFEYDEASFQSSAYEESWKQINLSSEQRRHLLFIFKEAMNNVLKYAAAKNVVFEVQQENRKITLTLRDDGKGFEQGSNQTGYGLKNMQARADKIGAKLRLVSAPASGSEISVTFHPLS